ncbi:hypothetical protein A9Q75_15875 [Colwellia psychrerythraea]|uniref:Uncharacterized protein n=1 Tax=Colwellia psychrerythraea TaxID=28229 RepID=A0A1Y5E1X6_COLPS|nr:hypothetical protein A9Q75_15875 [Colwellia psychrerythraea]
MARNEVGLAIRGGYAPDERVTAIKLMENNFIAVAAPSFLKMHCEPYYGDERIFTAGISR